MKKMLAVICVIYLSTSYAQNNTPPPCSSAEFNQFDFWLGNWKLTYNDTVHATNTITKDLDGCVIYEHFKDPSSKMNGNSWSMYNTQTKKWQQTWVDNQGGYITLTGVFENNIMALYTEAKLDSKGIKRQYRMLYNNITKNSFDWNWDTTVDEGKTWQSSWKIHYEKIK